MRDDVSLKNSEENTLKTNTRIRAPSHLTDATKAWYASVCRDYALEGHHLRLLQLAAEAWDRCQQAREILARDGITIEGREGGMRPHPAIAIERDSRLAFARLVAQLGLEAEEHVAANGNWKGVGYGQAYQ